MLEMRLHHVWEKSPQISLIDLARDAEAWRISELLPPEPLGSSILDTHVKKTAKYYALAQFV